MGISGVHWCITQATGAVVHVEPHVPVVAMCLDRIDYTAMQVSRAMDRAD
jgi:hypothetical protein